MKNYVIKVISFFLLINFSSHSFADSVKTTVRNLSMQLSLAPNQPKECDQFYGTQWQVKLIYHYDANRGKGSAIADIPNPTDSRAPIITWLQEQGDSDRDAFSVYYSPPMPLFVNHQLIYLYGIIFNHCPQDNSEQMGLVFNIQPVSGSQQCVFTTPVWNYCR